MNEPHKHNPLAPADLNEASRKAAIERGEINNAAPRRVEAPSTQEAAVAKGGKPKKAPFNQAQQGRNMPGGMPTKSPRTGKTSSGGKKPKGR